MLIFFATDVFIYVVELNVSHHVWWKAIVTAATALGIFCIAVTFYCAGSFPLGACSQYQ